jgi:N-acetylglucosaminyldiphosphoundecaprenol N-acetyl-beta-D-mannosaminyltransferase
MPKDFTRNLTIWDIPIQKTTLQEVESWLVQNYTKTFTPIFLATPNPEILLETEKNPLLKKILQTTFNIPDGVGLLWAAWYLQTIVPQTKHHVLKGLLSLVTLIFRQKKLTSVFPERVTGTDLMKRLCTKTFREKPIFLLGASKESNTKLTRILKNEYQSNIVGNDSSEWNDHKNLPQLLEKINHSKAEILFVAFGAPRQEIWLAQNISKLPHLKIAVGVGGAFDFLSNTRRRAPKIFQKLGIEWLFRLFIEPKRWKRILNATVVFPLKVISKAKKPNI